MSDLLLFEPDARSLREYFGLSDTHRRYIADVPVSAVCAARGMDAETLYRSIGADGLSFIVLNEKDHKEIHNMVREDWIYVYETKSLQGFLDRNERVLKEAGWPTKAADFAFHLGCVTAPARTKMFDLIHECYGNDPKTSDHGWLLNNRSQTPAHDIHVQREMAEESRQRFKAFRENDPKAGAWLLKLAEAGSMGSALDVSRLYEQGRGLEKNNVEAAFWDGLARSRASRTGKLCLPVMFSRVARERFGLTQQQKADIVRRIRSWKPSPVRNPLPPKPWY